MWFSFDESKRTKQPGGYLLMPSILHPIAKLDNAKADVIFVHGLGGDPIATWQPKENNPADSWPNWLASADETIGVYSLQYEAQPSAWLGSSLPLVDRATEVLTILEIDDIGKRPIIWVTHSLGGLLVKQLLRHADDQNNPAWQQVIEQTRSILFFATPHAGANLASWLTALGKILRATEVATDLRAHDHHLSNLNSWFRSEVMDRGVKIECFFETKPTLGVTVVNRTSADPGLPDVIPRPVEDADHTEICKPIDADDFRCRFLLKAIKDGLKRPLSKKGAGQAAGNGHVQIAKGTGIAQTAEGGTATVSIHGLPKD